MSRSPKLDEWLEKAPESWLKGVKRGAQDIETFKESFKQRMKEIGKEEILDYISTDRYNALFESYGGTITTEAPKAKQMKIYHPPTTSKTRQVQSKAYSRKGKAVKGYKAVRTGWTEGQSRFIKNRISYHDNKKLTSEFNTAFGTNRSVYSIRDKKLRSAKRKK